MRKLLLIFSMMFAFVIANATTVTFDFTKEAYGLPNDNDTYVETPTEIELNGVTLTLDGTWRMWSDGLRAYSKTYDASFTVTAKEPVTYVSWTVVSGAQFALEGTTDVITEWKGSTESVTFNSVAKDNKAVKTITVVYGEEGVVPEQPEVPKYNVAQTIEAINDGYTGEVEVTGYVTRITNFNSTYGSLTYFISDDGSTNDELQVYGGLGLNGDKFESIDDIQVMAKVTVKGSVKLYEGTPEVDLNSVILEYESPVSDSIEYVINDNNAQYFNLQGVRINNPDNGIYIKKTGSKIEKVIVRK